MTIKGGGAYPVQYRNPLTGITSDCSYYIDEQGNKKDASIYKFFVEGEWVTARNAPHNRETLRKYSNTKRGFMVALHRITRNRLKKRIERGREILGENELMDAPNELMNSKRSGAPTNENKPKIAQEFIKYFDEQVARHGYKCPLTHIPFTMFSNNKKFDINDQTKTFSNVSPDRIFNHIGYSKQNTIFTSQLWNLTKMERPIPELELILKTEIMERYKAIVVERFPDQKYKFNELENGAEHPQWGR